MQNESIDQLMNRCHCLAGQSLLQLSQHFNIPVPEKQLSRKGWVGQCIEYALGAPSKNLAIPDFSHLGIELKTIGVSKEGRPTESTFVSSIPLLTIHQQTWESSTCFAKLKCILWVPVEDDQSISFIHRRIGQPILWSPSEQDLLILKQDWEELTLLISCGKIAMINATLGQYLQIRPKAPNGLSLCDAYDEEGSRIKTMPRGFYLRRSFTSQFIVF